MQPPLRERQRVQTSGAIMSAAEAVFAAQGLRAARMEEIAARAGVSVGTLYNHFKDREALLCSLLEARGLELIGALDAALESGGSAPFPNQLELFTATLLDHFQTHRPFLTLVLEGEHQRGLPTSRNAAMLEIYKRAQSLMVRGLRKKALRTQGSDLWTALYMGAVRGVLVNALFDESKRPLGERAPEVVQFFLKGAGV
jgi:AcrR family transcriptional regulator